MNNEGEIMKKNVEQLQAMLKMFDETKQGMIDIASNMMNMKEVLEQHNQKLMKKDDHLSGN
jgi:hypothetical protein